MINLSNIIQLVSSIEGLNPKYSDTEYVLTLLYVLPLIYLQILSYLRVQEKGFKGLKNP